jgi:hypothetical protein
MNQKCQLRTNCEVVFAHLRHCWHGDIGHELADEKRTEKNLADNATVVEEPTESQNTTIMPIKLDKSELNELSEHFELEEPESTIGFQQANDESTSYDNSLRIPSRLIL